LPITPVDLGNVAIDGKKIVWGSESVTGSKNVDLSGKLSSIDYVIAAIGSDIGVNAMWVSFTFSGTTLTLKVWKPTAADGAAANVTPIAATVAVTVHYIAIGDPA